MIRVDATKEQITNHFKRRYAVKLGGEGGGFYMLEFAFGPFDYRTSFNGIRNVDDVVDMFDNYIVYMFENDIILCDCTTNLYDDYIINNLEVGQSFNFYFMEFKRFESQEHDVDPITISFDCPFPFETDHEFPLKFEYSDDAGMYQVVREMHAEIRRIMKSR